MVRERQKYLNVNRQSYILRRYITDKEMELFKTHRGSENYYFKRKGTKWGFYVKNQSKSATYTISKYHSHYNSRSYSQ